MAGLLTPLLRIGSIVGAVIVLVAGNYWWLLVCVAAFMLSFVTKRLANAGFEAGLRRYAAEAAAPYGRTVPPEVVRVLWRRDNSDFVALAQRYKSEHPDVHVNLRLRCFREACRAWARGEV